ncbi:hypothetical protein D9756_007366 [Leucocoprinus leucothites]|uniref:Uncharacterized protein n=1 Tax=Leucocoprinus leucothites TaxID=201217 RepID=A0A8H5FW65_9AGAR|nr:hypothetical protein D9756_007366 [Leucoagaricus leucothites]
MTIWSADNHTRHPWFDSQLKKRKHLAHNRETPSSSEELSDDVPETEPRASKRRRCSALEHGLSRLSLHHHHHKPLGLFLRNDEAHVQDRHAPTITEVTPPDYECAMDADDEGDDGIGARPPQVVLPGYVQEPEQDIPEIQMKTSSWYELSPDRIVITDLDSFEAEDESVGENGGIEINAPLLEHIKKQRSLPPPERTSQALVLFRPLPSLNVGPSKEPKETKKPRSEVVTDVELMEVET